MARVSLRIIDLLLATAIGTCLCPVGLVAQQPVHNPHPVAMTANDILPLTAEQRADLLMARGHYAAALELYEQIPNRSAVLWNKTGLAYHHLFALDEAMKCYQVAVHLNPHYAEALNNMGAIYHGKRMYREAERAYKRALRYQPRAAVIYGNLGTAFFAEGNAKKGMRAYQKALSLDPAVFADGRTERVEEGSSPAQRIAVNYSLAKVYAEAGRQQEAMEALRRAISAGFHDKKKLMEEHEFAGLHDLPEFQKVVEEEMR